MYIYDRWEFEEYPVVKISFNTLAYEDNNLEESLKDTLNTIASSHGLSLKKLHLKDQFNELISGLHLSFGKGVVLLIDEYDKPPIDYLNKDKRETALKNRGILKSFYSVLKDADPHLKLVFITGVSKFSKVSIFSDLNNLKDISLDLAYNEICGISQQELEENFVKELKLVDKEKVREWYNGYRWDEQGAKVYNPFSLLNFFDKKGKYGNFWYATGTPTFLMRMCREQHFYKFDEVISNAGDISNFDIENLQIVPVLFKTGYLTIKSENPVLRSLKLSFPNMEVKESYLRNLADMYMDPVRTSAATILEEFLESFKEGDVERFKSAINLAFSQIPYDLWIREREQFYHAIIHLMFSLLGVYIQSEVHTRHGRADAVVDYGGGVYCLEFKLDGSAAEAIAQIRAKGYLEKYANKEKKLHYIGINFSSAKKAVEEIVWENV